MKKMNAVEDVMKKMNAVEILPVKLECPKHGKFNGHKINLNGKTVTSICDVCAKEEADEARAKFIRESVRRSKESVLNRSGVPKRFKKHCFSSFGPTCMEANKTKAIMIRYAESFSKAKEHGTSFLFLGSTGTGKTHLACAVAEYLLSSGRTVLYITLADALSQIKVTWKANKDVTEDEIIARFGEFDLLIIDEIGTSKLKDSDPGILFRLANYRYERNLPMIGISKFQEPTEKYKPKKPWLRDLIGDDTVRRFRTGGGGILRFSWNEYNPMKVPF